MNARSTVVSDFCGACQIDGSASFSNEEGSKCMRALIKAPKDFWAGVVYVGIGLSALWLGQNYPIGTASRMGSGYFPLVLSILLIFFGALSLLRSFRTDGEPIDAIALRPLVLVLGACTLFALLLPRMGVIVALLVMALVSASASAKFRFEIKAAACLVLLIASCVLVFVKFLGIPMPLLGEWLEPVLGPIFPSLR